MSVGSCYLPRHRQDVGSKHSGSLEGWWKNRIRFEEGIRGISMGRASPNNKILSTK